MLRAGFWLRRSCETAGQAKCESRSKAHRKPLFSSIAKIACRDVFGKMVVQRAWYRVRLHLEVESKGWKATTPPFPTKSPPLGFCLLYPASKTKDSGKQSESHFDKQRRTWISLCERMAQIEGREGDEPFIQILHPLPERDFVLPLGSRDHSPKTRTLHISQKISLYSCSSRSHLATTSNTSPTSHAP